LEKPAKYKTVKMNSIFKDENLPPGSRSPVTNRLLGDDWHVEYVPQADRAKYTIKFEKGKVYGSTGRVYDTHAPGGVKAPGHEKAIYVMDASGDFYASTYEEVGRFHHSSLFGGEPVAAAGEIEIVDGKVVSINNKSGHYVPGKQELQQAVQSLGEKGVNLTKLDVGYFDAASRKTIHMTGTEFLAI
jgi:hypothetical protein